MGKKKEEDEVTEPKTSPPPTPEKQPQPNTAVTEPLCLRVRNELKNQSQKIYLETLTLAKLVEQIKDTFSVGDIAVYEKDGNDMDDITRDVQVKHLKSGTTIFFRELTTP